MWVQKFFHQKLTSRIEQNINSQCKKVATLLRVSQLSPISKLLQHLLLRTSTQLTFTYSKSAIETLLKSVKFVKS